MKQINFFKSIVGICAIAFLLTNQSWANENLRCSGDDCDGRGSKSSATPKDMVLVPGGSFLMGIDKVVNVDTKKMSARQKIRYAVSKEAFHDEGPAHNVILDAFHIDKYEVSNKKYSEFMKAADHPAPAYWDDSKRNKPNQPVSGVNYFDATAYCSWANKRLPTEAEWEKTARGPEGYKYPWGNELDMAKGNFGRKQEFTADVDAYPQGKSPYGAYSMAGNVFEWVSDWYDPNFYKKAKQTINPTGPVKGVFLSATGTYVDRYATGKKRVIRGGSWYAPAASSTTTHRFWNDPINNSYGVGLGFRCARTVQDNGMLQARTFYMDALISMGAEKYPQAMEAIEKALMQDGANAEYVQLKTMIKKQIP